MGFSSDGSKVAYCTLSYAEGASQGNTALVVRDISSQTDLQRVDLGSSIGCRVGQSGFDETGTQVTVSKVNYFPGDPNASTDGPIWQILILDTATGSVVAELNNTSPALSGLDIIQDGPVLPYVQRFTGGEIVFAEIPYGIGGGGEWNAFHWQLADATVAPIEYWGLIGLDMLPTTGELVFPALDPDAPAAEPGGPVPAYNIVKVVNADGAEQIIYRNSDWVVLDAKFIDGGQRVAVYLLAPFDQNNPSAQISRWVTIDRTGAVADLTPDSAFSSLRAASGGAVVLENAFLNADQTGGVRTSLTRYTGSTATPLWTLETADIQFNWELAWASPVTPAEGLSPFPPA
jgi:hypothetical protein